MVIVSLSETYDLSTKVNKMSLVGIHTPKNDIIKKHYPGLLMNCKYMRIVGQDVTLACASMLPADPLQVGISSGKIAPQDMFNPILYKAVSNDSMSTLELRLAQLLNTGIADVDGASAISTNTNVTMGQDEFKVYYSLLANHEGFKKAHPQQGLQMKNLKPLVFEQYFNYGENYTLAGSNQFPAIGQNSGKTAQTLQNKTVSSMRGNAHPMPRVNTTYLTAVDGSSSGFQSSGIEGAPNNCQIRVPEILPVYTACIVMPPCAQNQLFYRMTVRTYIEFTGIRPMQEIVSFGQMAGEIMPVVYYSDYTTQAKAMTATAGMVDAKDAEIEKIMEGA